MAPEGPFSFTLPLKQAIEEESRRFEKTYLWLEKAMPPAFFKEASMDWIPLVIHSLMTFREQNYSVEIHLKGVAISLCLESPDADVQILKKFAHQTIKRYHTFTSSIPLPPPDSSFLLRIAVVLFTETEDDLSQIKGTSYQQEALVSLLAEHQPSWSKELVSQLLSKVETRFLSTMSIEQQLLAIKMLERALTRDHCQYETERIEDWKEKETSSLRLVLAWKSPPKYYFLYRLARLFLRHQLRMEGVNASYVTPHSPQSILLLTLGLHGIDGRPAWEVADMDDLLRELALLKYFGTEDLIRETFVVTKLLSGNEAHFLRTLRHFVHQVLVQIDPYLYSPELVEEGLCRHPELTLHLVRAFDAKFNPARVDLIAFDSHRTQFLQMLDQLDTGHEHHDKRRKNILGQGLNFIDYIVKTNFFKKNKTAFAFRLDPRYLDHVPYDRTKIFPELPFGVFYLNGMHFIGFHIRFKDLSRGGLRTVFPDKKEKILAEQNVVFSECYNLAYTQHKKNKDIPEGGAKGVIFLKAHERLEAETIAYVKDLQAQGLSKEEVHEKTQFYLKEHRLESLYQAQRSYIKNLLSIINTDKEGHLRSKDIVDYYQKPEFIYLGPDENMHDVMIEWIAEESKKEHYLPGVCFISGKPNLGINHKQYGVTSLGVNVYMHEALKFIHKDPLSDIFTVKMTGGPDGDVAGNQILNLHRYYPKTAKLLALTDVSGTIFDPEGLDLEACVKLFHENKSIRFYPPEKLHSNGFLLDKENRKELSPHAFQTLCWQNRSGILTSEWLSGNEMNSLYRHNVHRTKADVFLPCGGRPLTLDTNVQDFLDESGVPTSRIIVEGANLYLSFFSRRFLEEKGTLVFKDSSANKGGVTCSSFEILSGLTLTEKEFLTHKDALVKEIQEKIRFLAQEEALLLLRTHQETNGFLTDISDQISAKINQFTDQLLNYLEPIALSDDPHDPFNQCFLHYCPDLLVKHFKDALLHKLPQGHRKAIIASHLSSRLVYKRGLGWSPSLIDILPVLLEDLSNILT